MKTTLATQPRTSLARDALGGAVLRAAAFAATYLSMIVLARVLGPTDFGSYSFHLTAAVLISFPLHLGLANLLLREAAIASSVGDWGRLWALIDSSNRLALAGALAIGLVIAIWCIWAPVGAPIDVSLAALSAIYIPVLALCALRAAVLRANRMPIAGQIPDQLIRPIIIVLVVAGLAAIGSPISDRTAMIATITAGAVGFGVGHLILKRRLPPRPMERTEPVSFNHASWAAFSFLAGATIINSSIGVVYLGLFGAPHDVGIYKVADQTSLVVAFLLGSINLVVAPKIAKLFSEHKLDVLQRLLIASSQLSLAAAIPAFLFFLIFGNDFLKFVFGAPFSHSHFPLMILAGGQLISAFAGSVGLVMNMSGNEKLTLRVSALSAALNLGICVLLYPILGVLGAAIAAATSMIFWNSTLAFFVSKRLGMNCTAFGRVTLRAFVESH